MKDLLKKMAQVANELDLQGLEKEANQVTMSMLKVAQGMAMPQPTPNPRSQFSQENQPVTVQVADNIADNTGTNVMRAGGENAITGTGKAFEGLVRLVEGFGQISIGALMSMVGSATLPVEAAAEIAGQLGHATTGPLLNTIEQQNAQIAALIKALQNAQRKGDKAQETQIKAQIAQSAKQGAQAARQISTMLEQRKAIPGQYKLDAAEFQKTLDYAVANKLTLRGMYDQAVRNRGGGADAQNFANNLIAKYRNIHGNVPDTALVVPTKLT